MAEWPVRPPLLRRAAQARPGIYAVNPAISRARDGVDTQKRNRLGLGLHAAWQGCVYAEGLLGRKRSFQGVRTCTCGRLFFLREWRRARTFYGVKGRRHKW